MVGTMSSVLIRLRFKDSRSAINLLVTPNSLSSCLTMDMKRKISGLKRDGSGPVELKAGGLSSGSIGLRTKLLNHQTLL
jgi:hypothetical protein